eukprot:TRINITY_DN19493_c0_g1_i2.p1 TRINITY_DN19493_c0_g1~~TRINITY_DN19493_c0_g1_i2.p1  ORF type:complete len:148 (+),score=54.84 TRINITY_DN19493_c0_g1_i2:212-655(+)
MTMAGSMAMAGERVAALRSQLAAGDQHAQLLEHNLDSAEQAAALWLEYAATADSEEAQAHQALLQSKSDLEIRHAACADLDREVLLAAAAVEAALDDLSSLDLSLIHISEPTRLLSISYAVFCLKKKKKKNDNRVSHRVGKNKRAKR